MGAKGRVRLLSLGDGASPNLRYALQKKNTSGGTDNEEFITGMVAVSVPIRDSKGRFCAAVAVHGPTQRLSLDTARKRLPALRRAARKIEALIEAF